MVVGMAAIGKVYQEHMIIAYGGGANGKSTFWKYGLQGNGNLRRKAVCGITDHEVQEEHHAGAGGTERGAGSSFHLRCRKGMRLNTFRCEAALLHG